MAAVEATIIIIVDPPLYYACPPEAISQATRVACRPAVRLCVACPFTARPRVETHVAAAAAAAAVEKSAFPIQLYGCNEINATTPAPV